MSVPLNLELARSYQDPYRHSWIPRLFPRMFNDHILEWLEQDLPWQFTETTFYRQLEFSFRDVKPPTKLAFLTSEETALKMSDWLQHEFGSPDVELVDVVAHLLEKGHGVGVHNDFQDDGETVRLLVQFGRGVKGGVTALCGSQCANSIRRVIEPIHGTAFAFPISQASYHAVSTVEQGQRFTVVYSFRPICQYR